MSWDKYNEARKKAKEAAEKAKSKDFSLSKSDKNQIKKAYNNAKANKWLFGVFAVITILALATLPFASFFESKINTTIQGEGVKAAITDVRSDSKLTITYVNVLQGDCILINLPDGKNMIIDAGSSFEYNRDFGASEIWPRIDAEISSYLLDASNRKIDYMIMTHPDFDHFSYMDEILEKYDVLNIYRPSVYYGVEESETNATKIAIAEAEKTRAGGNYVTEEMYKADKDTYSGFNVKVEGASSYGSVIGDIYNEGANVKFSKEGETITGQDSSGNEYEFKFWAPLDPIKLYTDWNDYSCFITLTYMDLGYCFTGDTEEKAEQDLIEAHGSELPDIDIMDAGHHGSKTSSSSALLNYLKPEVVICSCDDGSEYGHPAKSAMDRYREVGVPNNHIFTTHLNGTISVGLGYVDSTPNTQAEGGETTTPLKYAVGITKDGELVVTNVQWWYIVVGIIVFAGIMLLIVVPSAIKSYKKSTK
ncbi:MAG: MBL fold metallo-hydrolase [Clostridia bacterium]|nr:MBL fold metallo-hydrolase [Clostridia bacterium]